MTNSLALLDAPFNVSEVERTIKQLYAEKITDAEFEVFCLEAKALGLNPIKKEYIPLSFGNEKTNELDEQGRNVWRPTYVGYITVHGVRALAAKTGLLDGTDGPYWCGPDGNFLPVWLDFKTPPIAARFTVFVKGMSRPFHGVVTMKRAATYVDRKAGNVKKLTPKWAEDPATMLAIRAETDAYKRAGLLADHPIFGRGTAAELSEGFVVDQEAESRLQEGRKIHAIAANRGVSHDGVRTAVKQMDPEIVSMGQAHPQDLASTADQLSTFDAEGVARLADMDPKEVKGEPENPLPPEPDVLHTADELATPQQLEWIKRNQHSVNPETIPAESFEIIMRLDEIPLTFEMAEIVMRHISQHRMPPAQGSGKR